MAEWLTRTVGKNLNIVFLLYQGMAHYDYSSLGKTGSRIRWDRIHSLVRISPKISKAKIAINSYLCGDGYIAIREEMGKHFHYEISISIDELSLAKRVANLFKKEYHIEPNIKFQGGCFRVRIKNKPACLDLLSIGNYGHLRWQMPRKLPRELSKEWIKCFFDCEAHVNFRNKQIQIKSVNGAGLRSITKELKVFGIDSKIYGPYKQANINHNPYFLLILVTRESIVRYYKLIGFYHKAKQVALQNLVKNRQTL